jgi:hypothetical protein
MKWSQAKPLNGGESGRSSLPERNEGSPEREVLLVNLNFEI